jgi:hypothetical protein
MFWTRIPNLNLEDPLNGAARNRLELNLKRSSGKYDSLCRGRSPAEIGKHDILPI